MNKKTYPCSEDVRHFLTDFCFEVSSEIKFDDLVNETIQAWELRCGWRPFLASSEVSTRTFTVYRRLNRTKNEHNEFVDLRGGLIKIDKIKDHRGKVLKLGKDYTLYPEYTDLLLDGYQWLEPTGKGLSSHQVDITGCWGAFTDVPLVVWSAILKKIAAEALSCFSCTRDARLESWSEGGVSEKYRFHPFKDLIKRWESNFSRVLSQYRRVPGFV